MCPPADMFELAGVAGPLIEDYSHGMRQKLSFAACFLHDPKIVIVDEPWVGLDPKNIRFVKNFLRQKCRETGLTVFMSTHTLAIAEEIADLIGIINHGIFKSGGTVADIKTSPPPRFAGGCFWRLPGERGNSAPSRETAAVRGVTPGHESDLDHYSAKIRIARHEVAGVRNQSKLKVGVITVSATMLWIGAFVFFHMGFR